MPLRKTGPQATKLSTREQLLLRLRAKIASKLKPEKTKPKANKPQTPPPRQNGTDNLARLKAIIAEKRERHHTVKRDTYCGPYLVRGSGNKSELDKWIPKDRGTNNPEPGEGRTLTVAQALKRFYKLCRNESPQAQKYYQVNSLLGNSFWVFVYSCGYYITVTKSNKGMQGDHIVELWYRISYPTRKENFLIATSEYEGHLKHQPKIVSRLKVLINLRRFYVSSLTQQIIPL